MTPGEKVADDYASQAKLALGTGNASRSRDYRWAEKGARQAADVDKEQGTMNTTLAARAAASEERADYHWQKALNSEPGPCSTEHREAARDWTIIAQGLRSRAEKGAGR